MFKFYNLVLKASLMDSPFVSEKHDVWTAIGSGVSSLLGGILGNNAQKEANETNLQIARETNAMNRQLHESDIAQQERLWKLNNEYNLPSNVVQRLLDAGINPATLSGGNATTPASQISVPSAPQMVAPQVSPVDALANSVANGIPQAVNAYFQNELLNKQIGEKDVDTSIKQVQLQFSTSERLLDLYDKMWTVRERMSNVKKGSVEYKKLEEEYNMLKSQHNLLKDTYGDLKERESIQNDVLRSQKENILADTILKRAQSAYQDLLSAWYPQITQSQIQVNIAQFNDLVRSAEQKVKEGKLTDAKAVSQYLQNGIDALEFHKQNRRHKVHNSNKATRVFYGVLDEIGYNIFNNLKLFGK